MRRAFVLCFILLVIFASCSISFSYAYPSTHEWTPPDLSSATESTPELLVLKIAQEEVGYVEGPNNQSKYGEWYGTARCQWCAEFLTWCVDQVDQRYGTSLMDNIFPRYGLPQEGSPFFIQKSRFVSATGKLSKGNKQWWPDTESYVKPYDYIPEPGDYMFFALSRKSGTTHVAIVEGVSQQDGHIMVHVIEGNNPDAVQRNIYPIDHKNIYGYGTNRMKVRTEVQAYNNLVEIEEYKNALVSLGYYEGDNELNTFTKAMKTAVKRFQKDYDIKVTSTLTKNTVIKLYSFVSSFN